jgi:hypothetical protein
VAGGAAQTLAPDAHPAPTTGNPHTATTSAKPSGATTSPSPPDSSGRVKIKRGAPSLQQAIEVARGKAYVILDGSLLRIELHNAA